MKEDSIARASITIDPPASKDWKALTDSDLIKQYLFGTQVTTDCELFLCRAPAKSTSGTELPKQAILDRERY